jgi:glycosyltransferase involved in cell wall biosynthesis
VAGERIPATVVVMTRNEEANIAKCLRSVVRFEQVFVVDSRSEDRTREIAREHGATVVEFVWNGEYPKKKQWSLDNLSFAHDWVLYVDADEELTPEGADEVAKLLAGDPPHAGYFVPYDYVFIGRRLRHGHRVHKLVLLRRSRARFREVDDLDVENMWEVEGHYQPTIDGTVGTLRTAMIHDDHQTLFEFFSRHNRYSDWEATMRARGAIASTGESQPRSRALLKRTWDAAPLKGLLAFLYSYVLRAGFLDGRAGFHYALSRAYYYWEIQLKRRELERRR